MSRLILLLFITLCLSSTSYSQAGLSNKQLRKLKSSIKDDHEVARQYAIILLRADKALKDSPNPVDTISTEGRLKGDPIKVKTTAAIPDLQKIYDLALCYRIKNDKKYLDKAILFLHAWATINRSKGDPIDDTHLDAAIEGYVLIKDKLDLATNALVKTWLKQVSEAEIDVLKKFPRKETTYNNWNSHRLKILGEVAFAIADNDLQEFVIESLKLQIARNLNPDGTSIDFIKRDALHYHAYDLEPLLRLAILIKEKRNIDFYTFNSSTGSSLKKSMDWLGPYLTGEKKHEEFVHSTVKFDLERAKNGEADYVAGTLFKPAAGLKTLGLACYFDPNYLKVIQKIRDDQSKFSDWQLIMNNLYLVR